MSSAPAEAALLRYSYESLDLLLADLGEDPASAVLLYRAPSLQLAEGRPVVVEFSFRNAEQYRLISGVAGTRVAGEGTWLILQRRSLEELRRSGLPSRKQRRLGCDEAVAIRRGTQLSIARMRDLSPGGARLTSVPHLFVGEPVVLARWVDGKVSDLGPAEVSWIRGIDAGIAFDRRSDACRLSVGRLFTSLMQRWATAPEAVRAAPRLPRTADSNL